MKTLRHALHPPEIVPKLAEDQEQGINEHLSDQHVFPDN